METKTTQKDKETTKKTQTKIENPMRKIKIEKITLNVGVGKNTNLLEKSIKLFKELTGKKPIKTITQKRIPTWSLRPGLPIGCKLTLRNQTQIKDLLTRFLQANDNILEEKNFDENGNISFGIHEYINIPEVKYNPDIGIIGFEISITLEKPGFRIKRRRNQKKKIHKNHAITKSESIEFMKKEFNINIGEKE